MIKYYCVSQTFSMILLICSVVSILASAIYSKHFNLAYFNFCGWTPYEMLTDHQKPTGGPQTIPEKPPQNQNALSVVNAIQPHPHTMTQHTSCVGRATPPPHSHQPFTNCQPLLQPDHARNFTWVLKLINQLSRIWRLLAGQWSGVAMVKAADSWGHTHSYLCDINGAHQQGTAPESHAQLKATHPASTLILTCTAMLFWLTKTITKYLSFE